MHKALRSFVSACVRACSLYLCVYTCTYMRVSIAHGAHARRARILPKRVMATCAWLQIVAVSRKGCAWDAAATGSPELRLEGARDPTHPKHVHRPPILGPALQAACVTSGVMHDGILCIMCRKCMSCICLCMRAQQHACAVRPHVRTEREARNSSAAASFQTIPPPHPRVDPRCKWTC